MNSSLSEAFARSRARGARALVAYVMAGDPDLDATESLVPALAQAGADVIELGLPFSDPIADGPVLQAAAQRALRSGATVARVLELAGRLRDAGAPLVVMGYYNPILSMGERAFAHAAAQAGLAGAIVPDLPLEEAGPLMNALAAEGLDLVLLCAPTTPAERMRAIAHQARGFLYYVSVAGVTGARDALPEELGKRVRALKEIAGDVPVAVGFGISAPEQARAVAREADGVVVGSALVKLWAEQGGGAAAERAVVKLVRSLKAALEG